MRVITYAGVSLEQLAFLPFPLAPAKAHADICGDQRACYIYLGDSPHPQCVHSIAMVGEWQKKLIDTLRLRTYLLSQPHPDHIDAMKELAQQHGYYPIVPNGVADGAPLPFTVDLLIAGRAGTLHKLDPRIYGVNSSMHSVVDIATMRPYADKYNLHLNLAHCRFLAKSTPLDKFTWADGTYIIRPSDNFYCGGKDIIVVGSAEEFESAKGYYSALRRKEAARNHKSINILVSEYIKDPLLISGRKFHVRMYLAVICPEFAPPRLSLCPIGEILTAAAEFKLANWADKSTHDTHFTTSIPNLQYPRDFPRQDLLPTFTEQLAQLLGEITPLTRSTRVYPNARSGVIMTGIDVMFTETQIYLLEINYMPGLDLRGDDKLAYSRAIYQWMFPLFECSPKKYVLSDSTNSYADKYPDTDNTAGGILKTTASSVLLPWKVHYLILSSPLPRTYQIFYSWTNHHNWADHCRQYTGDESPPYCVYMDGPIVVATSEDAAAATARLRSREKSAALLSASTNATVAAGGQIAQTIAAIAFGSPNTVHIYTSEDTAAAKSLLESLTGPPNVCAPVKMLHTATEVLFIEETALEQEYFAHFSAFISSI